ICSLIFLNAGMEMDSLLDPVIDSSHRSYFAAVEHRALEMLRPRPDIRDKRRQPNSSALSSFQKDVTTRQPHQLTFKAVSLARTTDLSFYSEGLWRVVGKAASRRDRPSGSNAVL